MPGRYDCRRFHVDDVLYNGTKETAMQTGNCRRFDGRCFGFRSITGSFFKRVFGGSTEKNVFFYRLGKSFRLGDSCVTMLLLLGFGYIYVSGHWFSDFLEITLVLVSRCFVTELRDDFLA